MRDSDIVRTAPPFRFGIVHKLFLAGWIVSLASGSFAWEDVTIKSEGTIWGEQVPDREGRIVFGRTNHLYFAGISHTSYGGDRHSPVSVSVIFGEVVNHKLDTNTIISLDEFFHQPGMPVILELDADEAGNVVMVYGVHGHNTLLIRCAFRMNGIWQSEDLSPEYPFSPYSDSYFLDAGLVEGHPAVAYTVSDDTNLVWCVLDDNHVWTRTVLATNVSGPVDVTVSPEEIPSVAYMDTAGYAWAFHMHGSWHREVITTSKVSLATWAYDRDGSIAAVVADPLTTNLLFVRRGTFGGWGLRVMAFGTNFPVTALDLAFDQANVPCLAFHAGYEGYFARFNGVNQWLHHGFARSTCGVYSSPPCTYSYRHRGREPDLLFGEGEGPIIYHHGASGNIKVSSRVYYDDMSFIAPNKETPWLWVYHDDADGQNERATIPLPGSSDYPLPKTTFTEFETVDLRLITSMEFENLGGEVWVRWWNGTEEHWLRAWRERVLTLAAGNVNGTILTHPTNVLQWSCSLPASLTAPGTNYYAIQVKVGSALPLGGEEFDEDWLLRDLPESIGASLNHLGQAMAEQPDFVGHDWSVTILADADADGVPDEWESAYGLSTNENNALDDVDLDGWTVAEEYVLDSHPNEPTDFRVAIHLVENNQVEAVLTSTSPRRLYMLEHADTASPSAWTRYGTRVTGSGSNLRFTITQPGTSSLFRTRALLP